MAGLHFPSHRSFAVLRALTAVTIAANGMSAASSGGGSFRLPWANIPGRTGFAYTGPSATMRARSSAMEPFTDHDQAPLIPATWNWMNLNPDQPHGPQGWDSNGTQTIVKVGNGANAYLQINQADGASYFRGQTAGPAAPSNRHLIFSCIYRYPASSISGLSFVLYWQDAGGNWRTLRWSNVGGLWSNPATLTVSGLGISYPRFGPDVWHHPIVIHDYQNDPNYLHIWYRVANGPQDVRLAHEYLGKVPVGVGQAGLWLMGIGWFDFAGWANEMHLGHVGLYHGTDQWATLTPGGSWPAGSAYGNDWVQVDASSMAAGTMTELAIQTSAGTPGLVSGLAVRSAGSAALLAEWSATTAGDTYRVKMKRYGALQRTDYTADTIIAYTGLSDGDHSVEVETISSAARVSSSAAVSDDQPIPPPPSGTPPGAAPDPRPLQAPGWAPGAVYDNDGEGEVMRIYKHPPANIGSTPLASIVVRASDSSAGTDAAVLGTLDYPELAFPYTDTIGDFLTDHGLSDWQGKWMQCEYRAADGLSYYTGWVLMATDADRLCVINGQGLAGYKGMRVSLALSKPVKVLGKTFPRGGYTATIDDNGNWSLPVPRVAAAATLDGTDLATVKATIKIPDGSLPVDYVIPDEPAKAFEELEVDAPPAE